MQQMSAILDQNKPESGKFKVGNLEIEINKYDEKVPD